MYDVFMGCGTEAETPLAISLAEVAKRYGVPLKRVKALAQRGILPTVQLNGRTRVMVNELEPFFEDRIRAMGVIPPYEPDGDEGEQGISVM